jgi:hypothetical protein
MIGPLVCLALLAADPLATAPDPKDMAAYREAAARAGRDAEAHVKLALWCEQHGLGAERTRHLALAVLTDPTNALARGLLGLISDAGNWKRPEQVAERVRDDAALAATLAEYNELRARTSKTADGQWDLALWCERHGLKAEETAHLAAVVRLDPGRDGAWKRLGYKKHHGRWMTDAQIAEAAAENSAQKQADRRWRNVLEDCRKGLASKGRRAAAEKTLTEIHDPRAVPMVWQLFAARGKAADQLIAAQVLGQIDALAASQALAMLAVRSDSPDVRRRAIETLDDRDPRESVSLLIGQVYTPIKYKIQPIGGPGSQGKLFIEGPRFNVDRTYDVPTIMRSSMHLFDMDNDPAAQRALIRHAQGLGGIDLQGEPALQRELARIQRNIIAMRNAVLMEQALQASDVAMLDRMNTLGHRSNDERVLPALRAITGQNLGEDQNAWMKWWTEQQGYAFSPPPKKTYHQLAPVVDPLTGTFGVHHACFGAGTMVRTLAGSQKIETLQTGDRVLSRDINSGSLSYEPILAIFHNPPNETLRITLDGGDEIVVTPIHRFWKAGKGWTMARELKVGDPIRTVDGVRAITRIGKDGVQPVFNLLVAQHHSYFVGREAALVHDNSLIEPTPNPFDAAPRLAVAGEK